MLKWHYLNGDKETQYWEHRNSEQPHKARNKDELRHGICSQWAQSLDEKETVDP